MKEPDTNEPTLTSQEPAPLPPAEEEKASETEDQNHEVTEKTLGQLLREIKENLNVLWEAQRESILATIKVEPLDTKYEATRKQKREILHTIRTNAEKYWNKSGILKKRIHALTRKEDGVLFDYRHKLWHGVDIGHEGEKFNELNQWLENRDLARRAGCYCFKKGKEYLYIGKALVLADRINSHERSRYFTYANAIRIVIPHDRRNLEKLEKLLILAHPTEENICQSRTGTPIDDLWRFLEREVTELVEDAPYKDPLQGAKLRDE